MNEELKPCPFCGLKPSSRFETDEEGQLFYIECLTEDCGVNPKTDYFGIAESAIFRWNRRV